MITLGRRESDQPDSGSARTGRSGRGPLHRLADGATQAPCGRHEGTPPHMGYRRDMSEPGPEQDQQNAPPPTEPGKDPLRRSRTSSAWFAVVALAVLLLLLIIFIAQNTGTVEVSFLGWQGRAPLAVTLLIAALVGILLAVVAGSLRIVQLRRRVRRVRSRS